MNKFSVIVLSGVALALAGCGNQGGSGDQYNTGSGAASNTYERYGISSNYQAGARSSGRTNTGDGYSTNYPGLGTNDQGGATDSRAIEDGGQPIVPDRTNNVAED